MGRADPRLHRASLRKRFIIQPINIVQAHQTLAKGRLGAHHHALCAGIQAQHVQRFGPGKTQAPALPHGKMDHAIMPSQDPACGIDDLARLRRAGAQPFDQIAIAAIGHETNILTVRFCRDGQLESVSQRACRRFRR